MPADPPTLLIEQTLETPTYVETTLAAPPIFEVELEEPTFVEVAGSID